MHRGAIETPIGTVVATVDDRGRLTRLGFADAAVFTADEPPPACRPVLEQLMSYFRRDSMAFDVELAPTGSHFEHKVWRAVRAIPYGATETYGAIARRLGDPNAVRAVGLANARNPTAIVIPCHRVVGADGDLTGYAGGLWRKRWLLDHEAGQERLRF